MNLAITYLFGYIILFIERVVDNFYLYKSCKKGNYNDIKSIFLLQRETKNQHNILCQFLKHKEDEDQTLN